MSDMVRLVHPGVRRGASVLADEGEGPRPLSRERCVAFCDCDWPRSVRRHLAMATRKPRADFDRMASNDNRRKDFLRTLRWPPSYGRFADYLFVELEPVVADGIGGACRVRLWAAIFQSEPSLTSTRIQLPVTVSPGFKFGLSR